MSNVQSKLTQTQAQLAQGKQIINASDSPNQAATIQRLKSILNKQDSYQSSLNTINTSNHILSRKLFNCNGIKVSLIFNIDT